MHPSLVSSNNNSITERARQCCSELPFYTVMTKEANSPKEGGEQGVFPTQVAVRMK